MDKYDMGTKLGYVVRAMTPASKKHTARLSGWRGVTVALTVCMPWAGCGDVAGGH